VIASFEEGEVVPCGYGSTYDGLRGDIANRGQQIADVPPARSSAPRATAKQWFRLPKATLELRIEGDIEVLGLRSSSRPPATGDARDVSVGW